eukprot:TRINITY_DN57160_c0_g1_i2.p1 TRINITY_DN57160_c0_g1~~TRINITY_DN57160_c0_g1_i2.p1  ORF type:complete len:172 (-),score=10.37 TRINITY_DN57160_c0_g1_i2:2-517(-)
MAGATVDTPAGQNLISGVPPSMVAVPVAGGTRLIQEHQGQAVLSSATPSHGAVAGEETLSIPDPPMGTNTLVRKDTMKQYTVRPLPPNPTFWKLMRIGLTAGLLAPPLLIMGCTCVAFASPVCGWQGAHDVWAVMWMKLFGSYYSIAAYIAFTGMQLVWCVLIMSRCPEGM